MHGGVVVEQTAKFNHSESSQPADSSKGSERVEGLRKARMRTTTCTGELEGSKCCL